MRPQKKKKKWLGKLLGFGLLGLVILLVIGVLGFREWLNHYLGSDAFRTLLAERIGRAAQAECTLEPLRWSASGVYTPNASFKPAGGQGWKSIEADGVQATLDWGSARSGVWSIPSVNLDSVRMETQPSIKRAAQKPLPKDNQEEKESMPAWLQRWLPQRTEVGEVTIQNFDIKPAGGLPGVAIAGMKVSAKPTPNEEAWLLRGSEGTLTLPGLTTPFKMHSASARIDADALTLSDAVSHWLGDSEVTGRGSLPFTSTKPWHFSGHLERLDLRNILTEDWNQKLSGSLDGDYEATAAPPNEVELKGKLTLKNGVVQDLPVLSRVADFTHTDRFRHVVLDEAHWDMVRLGETTKVTDLVLQSNGLIRVEGGLTIKNRNLEGSFLVGVSPESLRWMPGAQAHVFTDPHPSGAPGFVWTRVRLTGNLDRGLNEDLSNRLLAAMGRALIETPLDAAQTGVDMLGKAGGSVLNNNGKGVIDKADDVVKKGVDAVKDLVPFLK